MTTIFAKALYELEKGHDLVLVTILSQDGSAPRGAGSQMLVGKDGRIVGTVGGGAVEYRCEQMAKDLLPQRRSAQHTFLLRENEDEDIGMVCGGDVTVWFQFVDAADPAWGVLAGRLLGQIRARKKGWLAQSMDGAVPTLLGENGEVLAGPGITGESFTLPLPIGERAVLFGGGHCAQALVPLLKSVGFRVTVMDCRPEYADPERFPDAERVICGDYLNISDFLTLTGEDYVVVMTNGHSFDFEVQEQVLRGELAYVGVIGSRSKKESVNRRLRERGVPEEAIRRIHTPVGTSILAVTPEEIAVSIAGEMIYERALRRQAHGKTSHGCPMR